MTDPPIPAESAPTPSGTWAPERRQPALELRGVKQVVMLIAGQRTLTLKWDSVPSRAKSALGIPRGRPAATSRPPAQAIALL